MNEEVKKNRATNIELKLRPIEGKKGKDTNGLVDTQLFTGDNKLWAVRNNQTCLWKMYYERGIVPTPLKSSYTNFNNLLKYATEYFKKRNIEIYEVID